jgi:hypothetical protein
MSIQCRIGGLFSSVIVAQMGCKMVLLTAATKPHERRESALLLLHLHYDKKLNQIASLAF